MTVMRWVAALVAAWMLSVVPAAAQSVTVFAAASLKDALGEVGQAYEARTGVKVKVSFAATSAIARQIEQGAPADVFVSADVKWMDYLAERKLIDAASRRDLLGNRLVLIAPAGSKTQLRIGPNMPLARALNGGRLAVAAPQVPAGRYAREALGALGVWDSVSNQVVDAENVRTALQYVARGEAPLGVVYETDAFVEPKVRIVGRFPAGSHPPIIYPAALTASTKSEQAAGFLNFMSGKEAMRIFRRYGFTAPAQAPKA
ncbi:molybdate ABC transporter substrate-binding protein [Phenylobacterium sp.]|uniref:molybdate ABC transporter substrate-binding protein n=1 Tax=Phenylobacterium sp. TaxID=1871053 RepID=UPI0035B4D639